MKFNKKYFNIIISIVLFLTLLSCTNDQTDQNSNNSGASNFAEKTTPNVSYGTNSMQVYDIYLPAKRDRKTPVILMVHGGAWKAGQKEEFNSYINFIKNKWKEVAIVNMNYRLASNTNKIHDKEIMADITAIIADVIAKKDSYQISTNMGIMGASAGGQLAMIYAYKFNNFKNIKCVGNLYGPSIINDWEWYNSFNIWMGTNVSTILTEYVGQPWETTAYKEVSPFWNVTPASQPTIIFHGTADPIVPLYQSQWMSGKLKNLGVPNEYHEYPAFHGFDEAQSSDVASKLVAFFKVYVK